MQIGRFLHIIGLFGILLSLSLVSCKKHHTEKKRILLIESYESDYNGYRQLYSQFRETLAEQNIDADIWTFYLDCDSYRDEDEKRRMYNFLDTASGWKPDIISVNDDQATYSLMACGHPLAKQIPVVFAGVNFPNWPLINQQTNVTGFWDKPEFVKTIKMIENLYGPRRICFWMDSTYLGRQTTQRFLNEIQIDGKAQVGDKTYTLNDKDSFSVYQDSLSILLNKGKFIEKPLQTGLSFISSRSTYSASLLWTLSGLNRYSIFVQCKRDFTSKRLGLIANNPTFTVVNEGFGFQEGLLGGYITSPLTERQYSAKTIADILKGKNIKDIPISETPKRYQVDWNEMVRWNLEARNIPAHYQIINMPFYQRYRTQLIFLGSLLVLAILMLISYLAHLYKRENLNKREAETKLRKSEKFLSLSLAGGKVYAFQIDNQDIEFDKDFYQTLGIEVAPVSIEQFRTFLHPSGKDEFEQSLNNMRNSTSPQNIFHIPCNFNGKGYQWWEFRYTFNKEENLISGLCLNVQKEKDSEQELIEARQKAEESDKMKSNFLANMSHEIRTPLNAIVGFSNLIAMEENMLEPEEKQEFLGLINTNSELLLKLINDILDLSRIESGKMDFVFAPCNLTDLIKDEFQTHRLLMPAGVELKMEIPGAPIVLHTDRHRLTQVITNFINNAAKFTSSGYIKIGYFIIPEKETVNIFVQDTGIGIPKEKQKDVFERFNKLNEFAQGTGLGLAICMVIVKRFGGQINLESEEGKGSRFNIELPLQIPASAGIRHKV